MCHYVNIEDCFMCSEGYKIISSYIRMNVLIPIELCICNVTFMVDNKV